MDFMQGYQPSKWIWQVNPAHQLTYGLTNGLQGPGMSWAQVLKQTAQCQMELLGDAIRNSPEFIKWNHHESTRVKAQSADFSQPTLLKLKSESVMLRYDEAWWIICDDEWCAGTAGRVQLLPEHTTKTFAREIPTCNQIGWAETRGAGHNWTVNPVNLPRETRWKNIIQKKHVEITSAWPFINKELWTP